MLSLVPRLSLIDVESLEKLLICMVGDVVHTDVLGSTTAQLIITRQHWLCARVTACLMIQTVEDQHLNC